MGVARFIAWRYLFSKKSVSAINLISGVSAIGVLVSTAALIIILSVFNGFGAFALRLFNVFTPDIRIEARSAKYFDPNRVGRILVGDKRIVSVAEVLQDKVLLRYGNQQFVCVLKGVSPSFFPKRYPMKMLQAGDFLLQRGEHSYLLVGAAVQSYLGVGLMDMYNSVAVYAPRKGRSNSFNIADEFSVQYAAVSGVWIPLQDLDNVAITSIGFVRNLLGESMGVSSLELRVLDESSVELLQRDLVKKLGKDFLVKNKVEQNELMYRLLNTEKWSVYFILCFVLLIAICNIIGSLSMLVIDKQQDIAVLVSMGASKGLIQRIFFLEGLFIVGVGSLFGLLLGYGFCYLQQQYGLVGLGSGVTLLESYPVKMYWSDFLGVFLTVLGLALPANFFASRLSIKNYEQIVKQIR